MLCKKLKKNTISNEIAHVYWTGKELD